MRPATGAVRPDEESAGLAAGHAMADAVAPHADASVEDDSQAHFIVELQRSTDALGEKRGLA